MRMGHYLQVAPVLPDFYYKYPLEEVARPCICDVRDLPQKFERLRPPFNEWSPEPDQALD
ncbi:MAG: hypothetical protein CW345_08090 [Firmicutes bacterium]|nr:hypothetical protein [Bacillota bacterium]